MRIGKFEQGGQSHLPAFIHYTPVVMSDTKASATASADTGSKESSGESDLTDKDLMTMLKSELDGLPNDRNYIIKQLTDFYLDQDLGFGSTASIETRYLQALNMAKNAKFNKELFDKAFEKIMSNGGIGEVAIDEHGQVFCDLGEGRYQRVPMQQFIQLKQEHPEIKAFTNQELLQLRKSDPNLVFDLNIVGMVQNGIGIEVVTKMINDAVRSLGSNELKREGYTQVEQQQIKNGLEYLQEAQEQMADLGLDFNTSVDGIYNMGVMTKDLAVLAKQALNYLYSTLPKNAKALLDLKAAESGKSSGQEIIQDIISSRISVVQTQDLSRTNNPKDGKGSSKGSSQYAGDDLSIMDKLKLSPVMMAQLGKTSRMPIRMLNGTKYQMTMNAQVVPIVNTSGSPLGAGVTLQDVSASQYAGALDFSNASMGGQALDNSALDSVIVDSTNLYIMNLPYTTDAHGTIIPDLKWLKTIETVDTQIREQGITDIKQINALYEKAGLPVLMDDAGNLNTRDYCKFGVLNGKASTSTFSQGEGGFDIMAREINDENIVKNYLNTVNKHRDKDSKIEFDDASWWDRLGLFWDNHDSLYEGTIYMPFRDDILNGALSSNQELTAQEASIIMGRNQLKERLAATGGYHSGGMEL